MLPRPPMFNKKFSRGPGVVLLGLAVLLAGCRPPGPQALLDGQRRLEAGELPRAIERLETATRLLGTNAHAWNYLGIAYHRDGQLTNAVLAYQRALQLDRNLLETRLNLGEALLGAGRAAEAKSEFTAYTLRRPGDSEGFERLAAAELRLREIAAAEAHARKAVQLDTNNPAAWNTLGLALLQRQRLTEAAAALEGALRANPRHPPALLNLAVLRQQGLNDRVGALKLYQQYLRLEPRPADAATVAALVRQLEAELTPARAAQATPASAPPPPAATATMVVRTSPPPTQATSPAPPTSPPVAARPTPAPPTNPPSPVTARPPAPPTPARPERVEVVTLAPEPELRPTPAMPSPAPVAPARPATPPAVPPPVSPTPEAPPTAAATERGFWESVNPARLFRREPKSGPRITPLPPVAEVEPAPSVSATSSRPPQTPPASETPRPTATFARYEYRTRFNVAPGDRDRAGALLARGNEAMAARRHEAAAGLFAEAAAADPSWFEAHQRHAAAALEAGRNLEALNAAETAVALRPDDGAARYNFALALRRNGYAPDAVAQLERVLAGDADNVAAHLTLGNIHAEQLRLRDKARFHYQRVLELSPRHPQAQAIRHWLAAHPR